MSRSWSPARSRCREYLTWTWPDWDAPVEALLHERRGGWADPMQTMRRLAERARAAGAEIREGVEVVGLRAERARAWGRWLPTTGRIACESARAGAGAVGGGRVALARARARGRRRGRAAAAARVLEGAGGRVRARGRRAERPRGDRGAGGAPRSGRSAALGPRRQRPRRGGLGHLLPHGPHRHGDHGRRAAGVAARPGLDPYGPDNPAHAAKPEFRDFFTSGLATALRRFRGGGGRLAGRRAAGGIVAPSPDNYPVCGWVLDNAYAIVDSGHGFKTLAIGRLAADEIAGDRDAATRVVPARSASRAGRLHAASKGPCPWTSTRELPPPRSRRQPRPRRRIRRSVEDATVSDQPVSPKLNELIIPTRRSLFASRWCCSTQGELRSRSFSQSPNARRGLDNHVVGSSGGDLP